LRLHVYIWVQGFNDTEPVAPVAVSGMKVASHIGEPGDQVRLCHSLLVFCYPVQPVTQDCRGVVRLACQRMGCAEELLDLGTLAILVHAFQGQTLEQKRYIRRAQPGVLGLLPYTIPRGGRATPRVLKLLTERAEAQQTDLARGMLPCNRDRPPQQPVAAPGDKLGKSQWGRVPLDLDSFAQQPLVVEDREILDAFGPEGRLECRLWLDQPAEGIEDLQPEAPQGWTGRIVATSVHSSPCVASRG
jgi:hypothetical protein